MFGPGENEKPISEPKIIAILWLIATGRDVKLAAARTGVSQGTLEKWMRDDPEFRERYEKEYSKYLGVDSEERHRLNTHIVSQLYSKTIEKIEAGELDGMTIKELIMAIRQLNTEMRIPLDGVRPKGSSKNKAESTEERQKRFRESQKRRTGGGDDERTRVH